MTTPPETGIPSPSTEESTHSSGSPNGRARASAAGLGPGELIKEITVDISTLIRKEIELAKTEVSEVLKSKLIGIGMIAIAGFMGLLLIPFLLLTLIDVLDIWLPKWGASATVTGAMVVIAGIIILIAKSKLSGKISPERTIRTLKEDMRWAKRRKT